MDSINNYSPTLKLLTNEERFALLFNNKKLADINFIVGKDNHRQRIPAHKVILSVGSAVFEAMFYGALATTADEVEITDIEPQAFLALLKYFYTNEIQINPEIVMSTLYAAKKYMVPVLEENCIEFLKSNLSTDNAFLFLSQSRLFDVPQLETLCLDVIDKNTMQALSADSFTDIDLNTLLVVLKRDTLQVYESKLYLAIILWSKAECVRRRVPSTAKNQRSTLGEAFNLVRYPLMTLKEFINGPVQSGLLSDTEVKQYCLDIAPNECSTEIPRCCKNYLECHLIFYHDTKTILNPQSYFKELFRFAEQVVIVGFVLCRSIIKYESNVILTLIDEKDTTIRYRASQCNNSHPSQDIFPIMFNRPILINPDSNYRVEIKIESFGSHQLCYFGHQWRRTQTGVIFGKDGKNLEDMKQDEYFSFFRCSGVIAEIIFYV